MNSIHQNGLYPDSIIGELYRGNICPEATAVPNSPAMEDIQLNLSNLHDQMSATFTDEQKALFDRFETCLQDQETLRETEVFTYAFKLGARMMLEMLEGSR